MTSIAPGREDDWGSVLRTVEDFTERRAAEEALEESDRRLRSFIDLSPTRLTYVDRDYRFRRVNARYLEFVRRPEAEVVGKTVAEVLGEDVFELLRPYFEQVWAGHELNFEIVRPVTDLGPRVLELHYVPDLNERGEVLGFYASTQDITDRKQAQKDLEDGEQRMRDFAETAADWFWESDAEHRTIYLSERFSDATGVPAEDVIGLSRSQRESKRELDSRSFDEVFGKFKERLAFREFEYDAAGPISDERRVLSLSAKPLFDGNGEFLGYRGTGRDVTEAHRLSEKLSPQASHDALTGLVNRRDFEQRLERVLDTVQLVHPEGGEHALCYLDLDQFKIINDTCGHVAGDELLRQLGRLLQGCVRRRDTLARLGGDEFGVLMEHCTLEQAQRVAEKLRGAVSDFRFSWDEHIFSIGVSIGLVPITRHSAGVTDVLAAADSACYVAKDEGRNRIHVYRHDDADLVRRHGEMQWVARINDALEAERFRLAALPIIPVAAAPEEGEFVELLLRMVDEQGKSIEPSAFFPAADRYGLSPRLDRWAIGAAFAWFSRHPHQLDRLHRFSINLSGATLTNEETLEFVHRQLEETKIPATKTCFEITETVAITNLALAVEFMEDLKELGCRFSLDDFGRGLSSYAYLKTLPVDYLKIDGVFVRDVLDDEIGLGLLRSINDLGKLMGKQTIAEFVPDQATLEKLREIGVDYAQGHGIGPLIELEDLA